MAKMSDEIKVGSVREIQETVPGISPVNTALMRGMTDMLRKLQMTEKRQAEALESTRAQIESVRAVIAGLA